MINNVFISESYKEQKVFEKQKNGGNIPPVNDERVKYVPIGCGKCMECRKQVARSWRVRLLEDIKEHKNGKFITLTFSNESIKELINQKPTKNWPSMKGLEGYELDNEIATRSVRLFLERWRKKFKKSLRHWLVTELGHNGSENIHLHGIIWTDESYSTIRDIWKYGYIWPRPETKVKTWVNAQTVNYIIKYVHKADEKHQFYKSKVLTSPGIGRHYMTKTDWKANKFNGKETNELYRTSDGSKIAMPIYWRNKIYSEEEREKLWLIKLDKNERWIMGEKVKIEQGEEEYYKLLEWYRIRNKKLGFGSDEKNWEREQYERERRIIKMQERLRNMPPAG